MPNYLDGSLKHARRVLGIRIRGRKGKQAVCVGKALSGSRPGSREKAQLALAAAARSCGRG